MRGALCEIQKQLGLCDDDMAKKLKLTVRRFKRLKKQSKTIPLNSLNILEELLKSEGWFDAK